MKQTQNRKKNAQTQPTKTPERWPYVADEGAGAVQKVYRRLTPIGNPSYMLPKYVEGKRCFECFSNAQEAINRAHAIARQMKAQSAAALEISNDDAKDFVSAKSALAEHGLLVSVPKATMDYASAAEILKPFPDVTIKDSVAKVAQWLKKVQTFEAIDEAVKFFELRVKPLQQKPVADAVTEFLEFKEKKQQRADAYVSTLRSYLDRFAEKHQCNLSTVTDASVHEWLESLDLSSNGFNTARRVMCAFFNWASAKTQRYAIEGVMEGIEELPEPHRRITYYQPVEMTRLLLAAQVRCDEFVPCLALAAFAGLRSAEIERLHWSDVREKFIHVQAEGAKTGMRRLVPIAPNLEAWLSPYRRKTGMLWTPKRKGDDSFYKAQMAVAGATEVKGDKRRGIAPMPAVKWLKNALRHSFISYRMAQSQNANQTALEAGNSVQICFSNYRELVTPEDAARWFNIFPEGVAASNVTPMRTVAAAGA
jgi:integrase